MKDTIGLSDDRLIRQNPIITRFLIPRRRMIRPVMLLATNAQTETKTSLKGQVATPELSRAAKQDYFLSRCEAGSGQKYGL